MNEKQREQRYDRAVTLIADAAGTFMGRIKPDIEGDAYGPVGCVALNVAFALYRGLMAPEPEGPPRMPQPQMDEVVGMVQVDVGELPPKIRAMFERARKAAMEHLQKQMRQPPPEE